MGFPGYSATAIGTTAELFSLADGQPLLQALFDLV